MNMYQKRNRYALQLANAWHRDLIKRAKHALKKQAAAERSKKRNTEQMFFVALHEKVIALAQAEILERLIFELQKPNPSPTFPGVLP